MSEALELVVQLRGAADHLKIACTRPTIEKLLRQASKAIEDTHLSSESFRKILRDIARLPDDSTMIHVKGIISLGLTAHYEALLTKAPVESKK